VELNLKDLDAFHMAVAMYAEAFVRRSRPMTSRTPLTIGSITSLRLSTSRCPMPSVQTKSDNARRRLCTVHFYRKGGMQFDYAVLSRIVPPLDESAMAVARERQAILTKPPGSLGRLEELSIQLAGISFIVHALPSRTK